MKRVPISFMKAVLKYHKVKTNVFLSNHKTILQEPADRKSAEKLWDILHNEGFLLIPDGGGYYSVEVRERGDSHTGLWSNLSEEEINAKCQEFIKEYQAKSRTC